MKNVAQLVIGGEQALLQLSLQAALHVQVVDGAQHQDGNEEQKQAQASVPPGDQVFLETARLSNPDSMLSPTSCSVRISAPPDGVQRKRIRYQREGTGLDAVETGTADCPPLLRRDHLTGAITSEYFLFRRGMSIEQVPSCCWRQPGRPGPAAHLHHGRAAGGRHPQPPAILFANPGLPHQAADVLRHSRPSALATPAGCSATGADPRARDGLPCLHPAAVLR